MQTDDTAALNRVGSNFPRGENDVGRS